MITAPTKLHYLHGAVFLMANRLNAAGDRISGENTTKQWFLLLFLNSMDEAAPSITSVAREMGTTRQNVTQLLGPLEKRGYVRTMPSKTDHRSRAVQMTEKARGYLSEMSARGRFFIESLMDGVDAGELDSAIRVFEKMFDNLDKINEKMERDIDGKEKDCSYL